MSNHDMTCGQCGRTWNDKETPTPAARCPFEYEHEPETRTFVLQETINYYVEVPAGIADDDIEEFLLGEVSEYDGDVQGFTDFWEDN